MNDNELELYDRQIRLWGHQAQERMKNTSILIINYNQLAYEVIKDIVLAGIGKVSITEEIDKDLLHLNPSVSISIVKEWEIKDYSIVLLISDERKEIVRVNGICRDNNVQFYTANIHGRYGYAFADLLVHEYTLERDVGNKKTAVGRINDSRSIISVISGEKESVTIRETYHSFEDSLKNPLGSRISKKEKLKVPSFFPMVLAILEGSNGERIEDIYKKEELVLPDDLLKQMDEFMAEKVVQLSPIAAVVGGCVAQDMLNVVGKREQPIQNWFLFDGYSLTGSVYYK